MATRWERVADLRRRVVEGPGRLDPAVRRAAFTGDPVPEPVAAFVDKVRHHAYKVTDTDVEMLHRAGFGDDEVFELTVSTALGAGLSRLDRARAVLDGS